MGVLIIKEAQARRAENYPSDRICFHKSQSAATEDQKNMKAYMDGQISLQKLCLLLAATNYLDKVTEAQAINELQITGWMR